MKKYAETEGNTPLSNSYVVFNNCCSNNIIFLPARASEQGNVIGLVSVYIYMYVVVIKKKL